jgi:protein involved in polysaccharide export with SLBB domain
MSPEFVEKLRGMNGSAADAALLQAQGLSEAEIQGLLGGTQAALLEPSALPDSIIVAERTETAPAEVDSAVVPEGELLPFGYGLFETSPETYVQPAYGPMDPDYPLGPGDEIVLDVWGDTVFRLERILDREGGVNLPDVGRVVLAGMTLQEARTALRRRLSRVYSGIGKSENDPSATTDLSVTLGNLRVVRVFVVGRARRPGGYDLSAASTVFHALFFAGGPTLEGSLRDIRVLRAGTEIAKFDVYEYLRTGRRSGDVRLENDDTVFIPPRGSRVVIQGAVRQPGIYEVTATETLRDLIETSGGFGERAFQGRIQVDRILSPDEERKSGEDRKVLDLAWNEESATESLRDGDTVTVFELTDRIRNFVIVQGEVRRPGKYQLPEGAKLSAVLNLAGGLLETAFLERAGIIRTFDDGRREQLSVDLRKVLAGEMSWDVNVLPRDEITIRSTADFEDPREVSVYGAVRAPGQYELRTNMTLRDLLLEAGGVLEHAYLDEVEVSRVRRDRKDLGLGITTTQVFRVPLGEDYLSTSGNDFHLEPFDNVFVRERPNYELQRNVTVRGEVRFPGVYSLVNQRETVSEVIGRAGGLKETAYAKGFQLFRTRDDVGRIALDLEAALKDPRSPDNIILFGGDSLYVPEEPKTVTVKGEVGYPTSLVYEPGLSIGDYVANAGGLTDKADKGQIRIVYSTGAAARVKRLWPDPEVQPGSTIIVPQKNEDAGVNWGEVIRDTTSILASLATVVLVVDRVGS